MDLPKSRDLRDRKGYYNYNPVTVLGIAVSLAVIGTISYYWNKKTTKENMLEAYNSKRSEIVDFNNKLKVLEFEVNELPEGGKTRLEKEIQIENTKEQLLQLESELAKLANELNIIQQKN